MAAQNSSFRAQYGVSIVWVFNVFESKGCLCFLVFVCVTVFLVRPPHKTAMLFVCSFPPHCALPRVFPHEGRVRLSPWCICVGERYQDRRGTSFFFHEQYYIPVPLNQSSVYSYRMSNSFITFGGKHNGWSGG